MTLYLVYWSRMIKTALIGSKAYYAWMAALLLVCAIGAYYYFQQLSQGLIVTNLTDEVSWGVYIANFTFVNGVETASVLLIIAAYFYHHKAVYEIVLLGELLTFSALLMCLLFITVDLGRPDRFLHIIPFIGKLNFPQSILAWDVVALNGYLLINMHIPGYLLYTMYKGKPANPKYYLPFIFISVFWAFSIQTVNAFLYSGLGGKPFWNSALLAPRFIISAFTSGPAVMILAFTAINSIYSNFKVKEEVFVLLKKIIAIFMLIQLFLLFCELFNQFYADTANVTSIRYLFFGLGGQNKLVPYIWTAIAFNIFSAIVYNTKLREKNKLFLFSCVLTILGGWIEKGMGLIIPAFVPSSLGDIVEYSPSVAEFWISAGIWALGILIFTINAKICIAIVSGKLREQQAVE